MSKLILHQLTRITLLSLFPPPLDTIPVGLASLMGMSLCIDPFPFTTTVPLVPWDSEAFNCAEAILVRFRGGACVSVPVDPELPTWNCPDVNLDRFRGCGGSWVRGENMASTGYKTTWRSSRGCGNGEEMKEERKRR